MNNFLARLPTPTFVAFIENALTRKTNFDIRPMVLALSYVHTPIAMAMPCSMRGTGAAFVKVAKSAIQKSPNVAWCIRYTNEQVSRRLYSEKAAYPFVARI